MIRPDSPRLRRAFPVPPVRIAHLGLGAFHRAHQAMYIAAAADGADWGVRAFTSRSVALPQVLTGQDCLYTVVERGAGADTFRIGTALADARPGGDVTAWRATCADERTSLITLTVTEAGYRLRPDGRLDHDDPAVRADVAALASDPAGAVPVTVVGRCVLGLLERFRGSGGGSGGAQVAIMSCDNLADNGTLLRHAVLGLIARLRPGSPDFAAWVERAVAFPCCVVDRITPATTDADIAAVKEATGIRDEAAVVTEPFSEWVIEDIMGVGGTGGPAVPPESGAPLPDLRSAGATLTGSVLPFEQRKLWMLNGAHTLLAFAGLRRGHATIADTFADDVCRSWVEQWWDTAARHVRPPAADVAGYRHALAQRWENARIRHLVTQVAQDPLEKLPVRVIPVLRRELAAGRLDAAAVRPIAAWLATTTDGERLTTDRVRAAVGALDAECAASDQVVALVRAVTAEMQAARPPRVAGRSKESGPSKG